MKKLLEQLKILSMQKNNRLITLLYLSVIVLIAVFPFFQPGLSGYMPDVAYHLLRIEGVKESLLSFDYPARIYGLFFNGYGYGSPLFYPDIFLVIPALLRIAGFEPLIAYKISIILLSVFLTVSTYYSMQYMTKNYWVSLTGTSMIVLSQFYLADMHDRAGYSEYIAFIFLPLLFVAIYDLLCLEGKKIYLFAVAMCGLLLSHTIMAFLSFVFLAVSFLFLLFIKKFRVKIFSRLLPLIGYAMLSVFVVAFYLFPFAEQIFWGDFMYKTPWAKIGNYYEPLNVLLFTIQGHFDTIAYVGIGVPILLGIIVLVIPIFRERGNFIGKFFFAVGLFFFAIMTKLVPWELFNESIINSIQFTYRFFPLAIISTISGMAVFLSKHDFTKKWVFNSIVLSFMISSCIFGFIQNKSISTNEDSLLFSEDYLYENAYEVGCGEWLPMDIDMSRLEADGENCVTDTDRRAYTWQSLGRGSFSFETGEKSSELFYVPLICYKGYSAYIYENGNKVFLPTISSEGYLCVGNPDGISGTVFVEYTGTKIQKISNIMSLLAIFLVMGLGVNSIVKNYRQHKTENHIMEV